MPLADRGLNTASLWKAPHLKISVIEKEKIMEFLKAVLGDKYSEFESLIKTFNEKPENKDKQVKLANLTSGKYVDKKKYDDAVAEKEKFETQLNEATETLKGFEGVNVEELQGKVKTLTADLETERTNHKQWVADREFSDALEKVIVKAKGKNTKAIKGILDLETLKASKNQEADIEAAVNAIKESDAYLFESDKPAPKIVDGTNGGAGGFSGKKPSEMTYTELCEYMEQNPGAEI